MSLKITAIALVLLSTFLLNADAVEEISSPASREIDVEIWNVIENTVANHDIAGMGNAYSQDAVLVTPKGTTPISGVLDRWGRDMDAMRNNGSSAKVVFRFSQRQDNPETASESGIFKYTIIDKAGSIKDFYYPFEQLIMKKNGKWRILMERQFSLVTEVEWNKLSR